MLDVTDYRYRPITRPNSTAGIIIWQSSTTGSWYNIQYYLSNQIPELFKDFLRIMIPILCVPSINSLIKPFNKKFVHFHYGTDTDNSSTYKKSVDSPVEVHHIEMKQYG